MQIILIQCFFLLLALSLGARGEEASPEERLKLAGEVHGIFQAKCLDCHGPELSKPKGKFGYVLDLHRVANNPDFVVRGEPEESELYRMVVENEMPGEDADVPPLTPEELAAVKRWIEMGAPGELPAAHVQTATAAPGPKLEMPFWKRTLRWIGRFHPVSTHFPVALMFVALAAEGMAFWTRRDSWMQTTRFLLVLAALGAISTVALGWINAYFASYTGQSAPILSWHRWLGTVSGVWAVICAGLSVLSPCSQGSPERKQLRGALLVGALLVGISGFLGSALIYGLDHYSWD